MKTKYKFLKYRKEGENTLLVDKRNYIKIYLYKGLLCFYVLEEIERNTSLDEIPYKIATKFNLPYNLVLLKVKKILNFLDKFSGSSDDRLVENNRIIKRNNSITFLPFLKSPVYISLLLTYRCNLRCRHCIDAFLHRDPKFGYENELSVKEISEIAKEMERDKIFAVVLNGGEPTVRKDFFSILEEFSSRGIDIGISTNGINFKNKEIVKRLNMYNITGYNISLEGSMDSTNDYIRGKGSFKKILKGLENLVDLGNGEKILVKVTYGKHNLYDLENIIKLLNKIGIKRVYFAALKPWGMAEKIKNLCPSFKEKEYVNKTLYLLKNSYPDMRIDGDVFYDRRVISFCPICISMDILPNGNVIPCTLFEVKLCSKVILGNIKMKNISEIWNSKKATKIRKISLTLTTKSICKNCIYHRYCAYRHCLAERFLNFGKFINFDIKFCYKNNKK